MSKNIKIQAMKYNLKSLYVMLKSNAKSKKKHSCAKSKERLSINYNKLIILYCINESRYSEPAEYQEDRERVIFVVFGKLCTSTLCIKLVTPSLGRS